ncbi:MAG: hypothetical protein ACRDUV_04925 [Pseudonocardiaceae bacterium]
MPENDTTKRRRARRPTEAAARLERLRKRNTDQLEAQREAERRIEAALKAYVDADVSISAVEQDQDDKVVGFERQITQTRTTAGAKIEEIRQQQAVAVWHISDAGRTVEQIAELLEMSQKDARRLLSIGRTAADSDVTGRGSKPANSTAPADPRQPAEQQPSAGVQASVEQRDLSRIDGHQDLADARLVPTVADGSGQRT